MKMDSLFIPRTEHGSKSNCMEIRVRVDFDHRYYEFRVDDSECTREDIIRRLTDADPDLKAYFSKGFVMWRGTMPIASIEKTRLVRHGDTMGLEKYYIIFTNDPVYASVQEKDVWEFTSFPS